jgi:predicted nucleic-acid-binding protein
VIALGTDILLRFSIGDDPKQGKTAKRFFEGLASEGETSSGSELDPSVR